MLFRSVRGRLAETPSRLDDVRDTCQRSGEALLEARSRARRVGRIAWFANTGVLLPPRLGVDVDDVAVLSEAVDKPDDARSVREHASPLLEREIGGHLHTEYRGNGQWNSRFCIARPSTRIRYERFTRRSLLN